MAKLLIGMDALVFCKLSAECNILYLHSSYYFISVRVDMTYDVALLEGIPGGSWNSSFTDCSGTLKNRELEALYWPSPQNS